MRRVIHVVATQLQQAAGHVSNGVKNFLCIAILPNKSFLFES